MKRTILLLPLLALAACTNEQPQTLKDALEGKFLIGAAINEAQIRYQAPAEDSLILTHFNAIEPENCLKSEEIQPQKGVFVWDLADKYVDFGTENNLAVYGHVLTWHSQLPDWFPKNEDGTDVTPEELKARMKEHIYTLVGRYKGRIKGWDVVNEAIMDDGSWRESPFYRILGEEYIPLSFQYAHEADPDAELYYNDYNMFRPEKAEAVVKLVNDLKARGLRIDAVGFQGHYGIDYPDFDEVQKAIDIVTATGVKIQFTEFDMTILPTLTRSADIGDMSFKDVVNDPELFEKHKDMFIPYPDGIPQEVQDKWNQRMEDFFALLLRNSDKILRLNVWGVQDGNSWKNEYPTVIPGREEAPLLFDRNLAEKPATRWLIENAKNY